jgi:hypothetical protein
MPEFICPKCSSSRLASWSLAQEKFQGDPLSAVTHVLFQGGKHFLLGELSTYGKVFDLRGKSLKRCENCHTCYLVCPDCDQLNLVNMSTLVLDKSTIQCSNCRKIILFASSTTYGVEGSG